MEWTGILEETYLEFGQRGEPDTLAVFDNGSAAAVEVNIDVLAFVHAELPGFQDQYTVLNACYVGWT